ncbi:hypothetical protein EDB86DRAFT_2831733 [Lactarius hatsudake]|nr:hypothetical protein EDB86DRAFT_2831733 [Lactarius hatsudake]
MSSSVPPTQLPPQPSPPPPGFMQSQASVLGPGVAGLFIQGIESGLVIAQFSQWFAALHRSESSVMTAVVIFVTVVGLRGSFASAWSKYVQHFGMLLLPAWEDNVHSIPTRTCSSLRVALPATENSARVTSTLNAFPEKVLLETFTVLMSVLLPSVLDLVLSGIVYAPRGRKRISRLVNIVWQYALPPTLCAVCLSALYIQYATSRQKQLQLWTPVIQQMIGKLYVLSLFHMTCVILVSPDSHTI